MSTLLSWFREKFGAVPPMLDPSDHPLTPTQAAFVEESIVASTLAQLDKALHPLPPREQKIGNTTVWWADGEEGRAFVVTEGGWDHERLAAEQTVLAALKQHGLKRQYIIMPEPDEDGSKLAFVKEADWNDIMAKAKRLIQSGNVRILRNGYNNVVAHVVGDHGDYTVELFRDDPKSRALTMWSCECPWSDYSFGRTRQFKKFEARPCSHALATMWQSQSTPLDSDAETEPPTPGQRGPAPKTPADIKGPTQPQLPFREHGPVEAPAPTGMEPAQTTQPGPEKSRMPERTPQQRPQQPMGQQPGAPPPAPGRPSVLPPFPGQQLQMFPPGQLPPGQPAPPGSTVSVPGARGPSPFGPVQYPGGTYSAADEKGFENGDFVRINIAEYGQMEGKSDPHGSGQYKEIPRNSIGEVMGHDPSTDWVEVIFEGPQDTAGRMEPYHVRAFVDAKNLTLMPSAYRPGIRRR